MPRSAYSQICWPQMPAALITSWHSTSNASPVRVLIALTPCTLSWVQQPQHLAVGEDAGAVLLGIQHVGGSQTEGVDRAVRHLNGADQRRVDVGFKAQRLGGIQLAGVDARQGAGVHEGILKMDVIFRQGDEEPPVSSTQWLAIRLRMRFS